MECRIQFRPIQLRTPYLTNTRGAHGKMTLLLPVSTAMQTILEGL